MMSLILLGFVAALNTTLADDAACRGCTERDAELARLVRVHQEQFERIGELERQVRALRAEAAAAEQRIAEAERTARTAEARVSELRAAMKADGDKVAVADVAHLMQAWAEGLVRIAIESEDVPDQARATFVRAFADSIEAICGEEPDLARLFKPTRDYLHRRAEVLRPGRVADQPPARAPRPPSVEELLARSERTPAAILELVAGCDRAEAARRCGRLLGRRVEWRGTVLETLDYDIVDWQLVCDCDGVTVRVSIARRFPGALAGIGVGSDVAVRGVVADLGSDFLGEPVVRLAGCEVADLISRP